MSSSDIVILMSLPESYLFPNISLLTLFSFPEFLFPDGPRSQRAYSMQSNSDLNLLADSVRPIMVP